METEMNTAAVTHLTVRLAMLYSTAASKKETEMSAAAVTQLTAHLMLYSAAA